MTTAPRADDPPSKNELVITPELRIPRDEFRFRYVRSSGPGGQNVNKVATQVQLHWDVAHTPSLPTDVRDRFLERYGHRINAEGMLVLRCQKHRTRKRNIEECLARLAGLIRAVVEPPRSRRPTRPPRSAVERRLKEKRLRSEKKARRRPPEQ